MPPSVVCQSVPLTTRRTLPSASVTSSWAISSGSLCVPLNLRYRSAVEMTFAVPLPSRTLRPLPPRRSSFVTSYVAYGTWSATSVLPGSSTASPTFWPFSPAS